MSDIKLEFDLVTGKNEVNKALDGIKSGAKSATSSFDSLSVGVTSYANNIKKAQLETNKFVDVSSSVRKSSNTFTEIASAASLSIAAIAGAAYSIKQFIGSAIESEEAVSDLNLALKQSGIFSQDASEGFQDLANEIQKTTVYGDEQILTMISLLQNLGSFTKGGLEKATKATIELASAFKLDLASAASLVGKAANGNIVAFQRMGIEIKKGKTDAETFANTLQALSKWQGDSSEKVKTLGGSLKYLSNQSGELIETLSKIVASTLGVKEAAISAANAVQKFNESINVDPLKVQAENTKIVAAGFEAQADYIDQEIEKYEELKAAKQKLARESAIINEEMISKQSKAVKDLLSVDFLSNQKASSNLLLSDIAKASNETQELLLNTKARQSELFAKNEEERSKARKEMITLADQVRNAGKTQEQAIADETTARLAQIEALYKRGAFKDFKEYTELRLQVERDYQDKIADLDKKRIDESFTVQKKNQEQLEKQMRENISNVSMGLSAASNVLNGKEGAKDLIGNTIGAIVDRFFPGLGTIISTIMKQLMGDPENTRAMIKAFTDSVPVLIGNIIQNIPVIIEELAKQLPVLVNSMTDMINSPEFWGRFLSNLVRAVGAAFMQIPKSIIASIPDFFKEFGKGLIGAIADGLAEALKAVVKGVGGVAEGVGGFLGDAVGWVGGAVGSVGDFFGFAKGGEIPQGYPNDTFPARLTSGEVVVDRSTVDRLNEFLERPQTQEVSVSDALLAQILEKLSMPMQVATTANVNGKAFADIILNLNRSNARLTV